MILKLIIADDHPIVREGLAGMLNAQSDFDVVAVADDGEKAVSLYHSHRPDVVIMDLRMPTMDGVSAIKAIKNIDSEAKILVLTTYDSDRDILPAIEAGATGYLLKDVPPAELFNAVRSAENGSSVLSPSVASRLMTHMRTPDEDKLTPREIEVLELVASGKTNKEIGKSLHISTSTVKTHLIHIYSKLGVDDRTSAVTTALERGWIAL